MRPLQLPTCFRRLFGAALAMAIRPSVEAHFSGDQASRAGGGCDPNIRRAYQHLESWGMPAAPPGPLWCELLGTHYRTIEDFIGTSVQEVLSATERTDRQGIAEGTAVLFADQSKIGRAHV